MSLATAVANNSFNSLSRYSFFLSVQMVIGSQLNPYFVIGLTQGLDTKTKLVKSIPKV